jgi:hypothetical protein
MTCCLDPKQKIRNPNTRLLDGGQVEIRNNDQIFKIQITKTIDKEIIPMIGYVLNI